MVVKVDTHFTLWFITLVAIIISTSFLIRMITKTILKFSVTSSEAGEFQSQKRKS